MNIHPIAAVRSLFGGKQLTDTQRILSHLEREKRNAFKSSESNRRNANWNALNENINLILNRELSTMRARSRWLFRNNPWAMGGQNTLRNFVIGVGMELQVQVVREERSQETGEFVTVEMERLNSFTEDLHRAWAENAHVGASDGCPDSMADLEEVAFDRWIEDGEVIVEWRINKAHDVVPFELRFIDPDNLDTFRTNAPNGNPVIMGVEVDRDTMKPLAYWEYTTAGTSDGPLQLPKVESRRVPASNVVHLFRKRFPLQLRGIPFAASVTQKFFDIEQYSDAQLTRNKIAAMFGVLFEGLTGGKSWFGGTSGVEETEGTAEGNWPKDADGNKLVNLAPGMVGGMPDGVTPHIISPTSPESTYTSFLESNLRAIGSGMDYGISFVGLTRDTSNTTFAGGRQAENMDFQGYRPCQRKFMRKFRTPIYYAWLDAAVLSSAVIMPGYFDVAPGKRFYRKHGWMPTGWNRGINPLQEVGASEKSMDNYITTLADECSFYGLDWRIQLRKAQRIENMKEELGLGTRLNAATGDDQQDQVDPAAADAAAQLQDMLVGT